MSEQTTTVSYGKRAGLTFHHDRGVAVMWSASGAERCDTDETFAGGVNWYGDGVDETYRVDE